MCELDYDTRKKAKNQQMVEDGLAELEALGKPEYARFITAEREKLESRKTAAHAAIGDKKRDTSIEGGGRYL